MDNEAAPDLLALTGVIVATHVANNSVHASDLPKLISAVHGALASLGAVQAAEPAEEEHIPAVSVRKSLASDDHIISMIDGKPYKTLRRHLTRHDLTEKEYRARYNLAADYPMVARSYSAARTAMAKAIGLGRKIGQKVERAAANVGTSVAEMATAVEAKATRGGKKAVDAPAPASPPAKRRGRKQAV